MRPMLLAIFVAGLLTARDDARADLLWRWSYAGGGASGSGFFSTVTTPDANGFFLITGISGTADGFPITALTPPGQAIPGNEPFAVDDLVRPGSQQLTSHGFGFSADGHESVNPFFNNGAYFAFISTGSGGSREPTVDFSATLVPEPASSGLVLVALTAVAVGRRLPPRSRHEALR